MPRTRGCLLLTDVTAVLAAANVSVTPPQQQLLSNLPSTMTELWKRLTQTWATCCQHCFITVNLVVLIGLDSSPDRMYNSMLE